MTVDFRCDTQSGHEFAAAIRRDAKSLLAILELDAAELSILITVDAAIRQLNRDFRGKDSPTDVLSFAQIQGAAESATRGQNQSAAESKPGLRLADSATHRTRGQIKTGANDKQTRAHQSRTDPLRKAATDVTDDAPPPVALGDIVISIETAQRQAGAMRQPAAERLRTLLIHGLLHLLGYDHERSPAEARRMFARERELAAVLAARRDARTARTRTRLSKAIKARHARPSS